jgi:hypothetical protein
VNYVVLVLERSLREEKLAACDHETVVVVKVGSDDDVGDARLIFH